jgi:hypothetical protein
MVGNVILFIIMDIVQYRALKKENEYKHPYHNLK